MAIRNRAERRSQRAIAQERIDTIVDMMTHGQWIPGAADKALAAKWGIKPVSVRRYSEAASQIVTHFIGRDDEVKSHVLASIHAIAGLALSRAREKGEGGELVHKDAQRYLDTALKAFQQLSMIVGIDAPKKLEIKTEAATLDDIDALEKNLGINTACPTDDASSSFVKH